MRRTIVAGLVGAALLAIGTSAGAGASATAIDSAKLTPAMRALVANGYGSYPIQDLVSSYTPGTIYYLAKVRGSAVGAASALSAAGASVRAIFGESHWLAVSSQPSAVAAVSQLQQVVRLDMDLPRTVLSTNVHYASGPAYADQAKRGPHDVGADKLWAQGTIGSGVTVGVVDSGIDSTHPDLSPDFKGFYNCNDVVPTLVGDDAGWCVSMPFGIDDNGHGTHVAGIIGGSAVGGTAAQAGLYPGMAPGAALVGAKVCTAAGSCLTSAVMAGVRQLALEPTQGGLGADIINLSLGSDRFYLEPLGASQVTNADALDEEMNSLAQLNNVLFTVAAGNSGPTLQSVGNPADASQVLAVGASISDWDLNHAREDTAHGELGNLRPEAAAAGATGIAQFSSRGPSGDRLIKPDVTAPGVYVISAQAKAGGEIAAGDSVHTSNFSTDPYYAVLSGTSMAAPSAAGAAALVWSGYEHATGSDPAYYRLKAALVNTALTHAYEGSVVGLISGIKAERGGQDPNQLFPLRNQSWVGVTGEGAGRINAPAALNALLRGVVVYTPQTTLADIHSLQPSWSVDLVGRGESRSATFTVHGGPKLGGTASSTFAYVPESEPQGVLSLPKLWLTLPSSTVQTTTGNEGSFTLTVAVPNAAKPGMYEGTVLVRTTLPNGAVEYDRVPVQLFVPLWMPAGGVASLEGPIWASGTTDYTAVGFENPVGGILTDWTNIPLRIPAGVTRVDLSVYDTAGKDHMDVFVFDNAGNEIDSTVATNMEDDVPNGALYAPTSAASPETVSILDGADLETVTAPTTVWLDVSDSNPANTTAPIPFSTYHLDVKFVR
jgi:subtilisin family serine protease